MTCRSQSGPALWTGSGCQWYRRNAQLSVSRGWLSPGCATSLAKSRSPYRQLSNRDSNRAIPPTGCEPAQGLLGQVPARGLCAHGDRLCWAFSGRPGPPCLLWLRGRQSPPQSSRCDAPGPNSPRARRRRALPAARPEFAAPAPAPKRPPFPPSRVLTKAHHGGRSASESRAPAS